MSEALGSMLAEPRVLLVHLLVRRSGRFGYVVCVLDQTHDRVGSSFDDRVFDSKH